MVAYSCFLPPDLVEALARRTDDGALPFSRKFPAALLFADISGFTALTEKLQKRGREGAEEITDVINRVLAGAIDCLSRFGGSIFSFGGDAVFVVFSGGNPVSRAQAAAQEIGSQFERRGPVSTSVGSVSLGISQAVHYTNVVGMHLGRDGRRQYLVAGPGVAALARLEKRAMTGQILLSRSARAQRKVEGAARRSVRKRPKVSEARLRRYIEPHVLKAANHFDGEYRPVVMMFLETKGYSVKKLQRFVVLLRRLLDKYEGILVSPDLSTFGTKWLCAFGAPTAHEDDPDRAALAALDLLDGCPSGLAMRGGMDSGTVANIWIGTEIRRSFELMGDVTNTAARVAARAHWHQIVITGRAKRQLMAAETIPLGAFIAKGKAKPLEIHALKERRSVVTQLRATCPLVGRDEERRRLVMALEEAKAGRGSVVWLKGAAGIGKSRLVSEATQLWRRMGFQAGEGRALPFGATPYQAVRDLLRRLLSLPAAAGRKTILARVSWAAQELQLKAVDRHHLAELAGARYNESPLGCLDGKTIHLNNMIAFEAFCHALGKQRPHLFVLEDMHWSQGTTRETVAFLMRRIRRHPLVLLLVSRPGYEAPGDAFEIELGALPEEFSEILLKGHLGAVSEEVIRLVRGKAEGNPLYLEEVLRHLIETGQIEKRDGVYRLCGRAIAGDLPGTIESLIASRLDRLDSTVKRVARSASVLGRTFLFEVLACLERADARRSVDELQVQSVVVEREKEPHREFSFNQMMVRDVAYFGLLKKRRRQLHRAAAGAIESLFAAERAIFLPTIAYHREQGGQHREARAAYLVSARHAAKRYAHDEASDLYGSYLRLVDVPSKESISARHELGEKVFRALGRMKEAEEQFRKAIEEAQRLGANDREGESYRLLGMILNETARVGDARKLFDKAIEIARQSGNRRLEGDALGNLATLLDQQGRSEEARELLRQALAIARVEKNCRSEGHLLGNLGNSLLDAGLLDEAVVHYERVRSIAAEVGDRRLQCLVLGNLAGICLRQDRMERGRELLAEALAIARELGDRLLEGAWLGNLAVLQPRSRADERRILYEQALDIHRTVGNSRAEGMVLGNLATLHLQQGRLPQALTLFKKALAIHRTVGNRRFEGFALGYLARSELLATGNVVAAKELAAEAESLLRTLDDAAGLGKVVCISGHIALAAGDNAEDRAAEARSLASDCSDSGDESLLRSIEVLDRAVGAQSEGRPLVTGYLQEDLSGGQLRWLRTHRPEAIP